MGSALSVSSIALAVSGTVGFVTCRLIGWSMLASAYSIVVAGGIASATVYAAPVASDSRALALSLVVPSFGIL